MKKTIDEESYRFVWKSTCEEKNKKKNKVRTSWCTANVHEMIEDD
jgi:hypothetical protein